MNSRALLVALHVATSLACFSSPPTRVIKRISEDSLLRYPQDGNTYGQIKSMQWSFTISKDEVVKLTFRTLDTQPSRDVLEIFDGDVRIAYFTGKSVPLYPTFIKADNSKVEFNVQSNERLAGFTIRAEYVAASTGAGTFTFDKGLGDWRDVHSDRIGWKHQQKDSIDVGNIKFDSTSPTGRGGWAELNVQRMWEPDWAELVSPVIRRTKYASLWRLKMNVNDHFTKSSFQVLLRQKSKQDKLIWQNDNNGGFYETVPFSEWTHREIDIRVPSPRSSFQIVIKVVKNDWYGDEDRRVGIDDVTISPADRSKDSEMCGIRSGIEHDRIYNGRQSDSNAWPWLVLIQIVLPDREKSSCIGSIVDKRWILTARHCLTMDENGLKFHGIQVVFGVHAHSKFDHNKDADQYSIRIYDTDMYTPNDVTYSKDGAGVSYLKQDVALLKLPVDLQFTSKVSPLCLPEKNDELPVGTMLTFAGWGFNPDNPKSAELNEVELMLKKRRCILRKHRQGRYLCTYTLRRDVCSGDSGGPGMIYDNIRGRWKMVASVVAGPSCMRVASGLIANGFSTDIILVIDWINHIMDTY